jgi:VanZ family protein
MKKVLFLVPLIGAIATMIVIFALSAQTADISNSGSMVISEAVHKVVTEITPDSGITIKDINHFVRKGAHFCAYLLLSIFIFWALRLTMPERNILTAVMCLIFCAAYAISDETHQLFVSGRGPGITDVIIDSAGAIAGMLIYYLLSLLFHKRK